MTEPIVPVVAGGLSVTAGMIFGIPAESVFAGFVGALAARALLANAEQPQSFAQWFLAFLGVVSATLFAAVLTPISTIILLAYFPAAPLVPVYLLVGAALGASSQSLVEMFRAFTNGLGEFAASNLSRIFGIKKEGEL